MHVVIVISYILIYKFDILFQLAIFPVLGYQLISGCGCVFSEQRKSGEMELEVCL